MSLPGRRGGRSAHRLRLRCAWAVLACALAAAAAVAGERPRAPPVPPDRLALERVGLPIVWRGRLVNYVFVDARVKLAPGRAVEAVRGREPYLRDALVRAGHQTPFVDRADLSRVDERALDLALLREARRILGPGVVGAEVTAQQPRRRLAPPRPEATAGPAGRPIVP